MCLLFWGAREMEGREGAGRGQNIPVSVRNKVRNLDQSQLLPLVFLLCPQFTNQHSFCGASSECSDQLLQMTSDSLFLSKRIHPETVPNSKSFHWWKNQRGIEQISWLLYTKWTNGLLTSSCGQHYTCCWPRGAVLHLWWIQNTFTKLLYNRGKTFFLFFGHFKLMMLEMNWLSINLIIQNLFQNELVAVVWTV